MSEIIGLYMSLISLPPLPPIHLKNSQADRDAKKARCHPKVLRVGQSLSCSEAFLPPIRLPSDESPSLLARRFTTSSLPPASFDSSRVSHLLITIEAPEENGDSKRLPQLKKLPIDPSKLTLPKPRSSKHTVEVLREQAKNALRHNRWDLVIRLSLIIQAKVSGDPEAIKMMEIAALNKYRLGY